MTAQQPVVLSPRYYLDNFRYVLSVVRRLYSKLLNPAELDFLNRFDALSDDAQCLFVRMSNRRGRFFRVARFNYPEISDLPGALAELLGNGFAEPLSARHQPEAEAALDIFTKPDLLQLLPLDAEEVRSLGKLKKDEIVRYAVQELNLEPIVAALAARETVVGVAFGAEVMMMKYLFFGNRGSDMTDFVVRDLGMVRVEPYDESKLTARFQTRQEVDDKLLISLTAELFYDLTQAETPAQAVYDWFLTWNDYLTTRPALTAIARPGYDRLVCKVGAFLERAKLPDQALTVYQLTDHVPARERRVRLLFRNGLLEEARALCDEMTLTPQNADERYFARDFREKIENTGQKKRSRKATTRFLSDADTLTIPVAYRHHVEAGVMNYYLERGHDAAFTENYPWRGLFGLIFWDIIYDADSQAIHHPLQRGPSDFYAPDFYPRREARINARLTDLATTADWQTQTERVFREKNGLENPLVDWSDELLPLVQQLIRLLEVEQLRLILREMAHNIREHARGFPDLLVWQPDGTYSFVEVKSPTDHLGAQQLHWMEFFQTIDVPAQVVRVVWEA